MPNPGPNVEEAWTLARDDRGTRWDGGETEWDGGATLWDPEVENPESWTYDSRQ